MKVAVPSDAIGRRLAGLIFSYCQYRQHPGRRQQRHLSALLTLDKNREYIGFGLATGRTIESATEFLENHHIPLPDVLITSVGAEIYYGKNLHLGADGKPIYPPSGTAKKLSACSRTLRF